PSIRSDGSHRTLRRCRHGSTRKRADNSASMDPSETSGLRQTQDVALTHPSGRCFETCVPALRQPRTDSSSFLSPRVTHRAEKLCTLRRSAAPEEIRAYAHIN